MLRNQYRILWNESEALEPQDDWGFIQDVVAPPPVPAPAPVAAPAPAPVIPPPAAPAPIDWQPLAQQISQQWQGFGISPDVKGINRANELAQILSNYGISDLSKIGIKQTPYEEMRGQNIGGESGEYIEELYKGNRGQLTYGDQTFGRLGGFGSSGGKEFAAPQEYLTEAGDGRYGLAYSAAGKGWTDYEVVVRPDGTPVIVPKWGSSSDVDPGLVQVLGLMAMPFTGGLSSALAGAGLGTVGGQIAANALISGGLGGLSSAAQGGSFGEGFGRGAVAGGIGSFATPYLNEFANTASQAVGGDMLGKITSGAVQGAGRSAIGAAISGNSIGDALLSGAVGGATGAGTDILVKGTNSTLNEYLKDVPAPVRNAVTSAATAGLLGKDPEKAVINSFIGSLMKEVSPTGGKKLADVTGAGAIEGFFDKEGEGYYEEPSLFPEFDQPLLTAEPPAPAPSFTPPSDEVYEDIESLLARYEDQGYATQPTTAMPPMELNRFLEANIEDPGTVETLMQEYYPELYRQQVEVTGRQTPTETFYELPEAPSMQEPIYEQPPTPAPSPAPAPAPAPTPAAAPAPSPAAAAKKKQDDLALLMMLSAMMTPQQKQEERTELARILNLGPMDLLV
jgi:hypothetical protein